MDHLKPELKQTPACFIHSVEQCMRASAQILERDEVSEGRVEKFQGLLAATGSRNDEIGMHAERNEKRR